MYDFASKFPQGLSYQEFLAAHATPAQRDRWERTRGQIVLSPAQRELLASFRRRMGLLCLAGAWCGDCVEQCPMFDRFQEACPVLEVRFFDRDAHPDLKAELAICGGSRVPAVVFLSEDGFPVSRLGDRTLAKYRQLAADQLGPSCPTGLLAPAPELQAAVLEEWLHECERVQLLLRLSPRLREKHGD